MIKGACQLWSSCLFYHDHIKNVGFFLKVAGRDLGEIWLHLVVWATVLSR